MPPQPPRTVSPLSLCSCPGLRCRPRLGQGTGPLLPFFSPPPAGFVYTPLSCCSCCALTAAPERRGPALIFLLRMCRVCNFPEKPPWPEHPGPLLEGEGGKQSVTGLVTHVQPEGFMILLETSDWRGIFHVIETLPTTSRGQGGIM